MSNIGVGARCRHSSITPGERTTNREMISKMSLSKIIVTLILMTSSTWVATTTAASARGKTTSITSSFLSSSASLPPSSSPQRQQSPPPAATAAAAAAASTPAASGTSLIHHRQASLGHRARASVRGLATSKFNYNTTSIINNDNNSRHHRPHYSQRLYSRLMLMVDQQPLLVNNLVESDIAKHLPANPSDALSNVSSSSSSSSVASSSSSSSTLGRTTNTSEQVFNYILHNDEEILQWIHQVSRGKRCVRAVLAQIPPAPVAVPLGASSAAAAAAAAAVAVASTSPEVAKTIPLTLAAAAAAAGGGAQRPSPAAETSASAATTGVIKSLLLTPGQGTTAMANALHSHIPLPVTPEKQRELRTVFTDNVRGRRVRRCVDLLAKVLAGYNATADSYGLLLKAMETVPTVENNIYRFWIAWTIKNVRNRPAEGEEKMNEEGDGDGGEGEGGHKKVPDGPQTELAWFHCSRGGVGNETSCRPGKKQGETSWLNASNTWLPESLTQRLLDGEIYVGDQELGSDGDPLVEWSDVFFDCLDQRWYIAYHGLIVEPSPRGKANETDDETGAWYTVKGVIRADVDISKTDINQCDRHTDHDKLVNDENPLVLTLVTSANERRALELGAEMDEPLPVYSQFYLHHAKEIRQHQRQHHHHHHHHHQHRDPKNKDGDMVLDMFGTHKCHSENSWCQFEPGHGMLRGGYICKCKDGYHSAVSHLGPTFKGVNMEDSFHDKLMGKNPSYDYMYYCKRCAPGCEMCVDESPCLSTYNWAFRISLLTITILCILFVFIIAFNIYRHRKLKVIKVASPVFLCLTLLGCVIMYLEAVAIFPVLNASICVLTKWTRHFGFCITYSALLLKTWRVSLTYRVKSAHKIKLTDKQLLQWLFPILLVMAIYLGAWTISDTPQAVYIIDWNHLKFKQCDYNWWDHSLAIGEFIFLLWGIKVCYNVRNAESLFNEAKYIVWAIYNITLVNIIMILIHVFILPNSGPDIKYFFGFVRTQLSTTVTVILIFGPKFYRVIKGQGDLWDNQLRARGLAATYSFNGVGVTHEETTDLYQENEELKEEIQKLASQLEIMKICQMEFKNRHLGKARETK